MKLALIGNGPSLKGFPLQSLSEIETFGMNAAYRYWEEIGWYPSYYACLDNVVGISHKENILGMVANAKKLGIKKFFVRNNLYNWLEEQKNTKRVFNYDSLALRLPELGHPITTGSEAAVLAILMGFRNIGLFGIDCDYKNHVKSKKVGGSILQMTETPKENPNYFFNEYQKYGDFFNVAEVSPNFHRNSWNKVKWVSDRYGANIVNCCQRSPFDLFPFFLADEFILRS